MRSDTARPHANALQGFALLSRQAQAWIILAQIDRRAGLQHTIRNAAREPFQRIASFFDGEFGMRRQEAGNLGHGPLLQPLARRFPLGRVDFRRADNLDPGGHPARSLGQVRDRRIDMFDLAFIIQLEGIIRGRHDQRQPLQDQRAHSGLRRAAHGLAFQRPGIQHRLESQAFQASDNMAFHTDITFRGQFGHESVFLLQAG